MKKVIVANVQRCTACRSCQIACAVAHSESKTLQGALAEDPRPVPRVMIEDARGMAVPLQCRHCEDAPCVAVCPTCALKRMDDDSPVVLERERCIGCRWCVTACPFGVIKMSRDGRAVIKCDLCVERLAEGQLPACVEACPTRALEYRQLDEVAAAKRKATAEQMAFEVESRE